MQVYTKSLRPSERTEIFLEEYLAQHQHLPGDRLPSPRKIATELGVSESTVRGVVRRWLKDGRLRSRQGSGIFICKPVVRDAEPVRIGANIRNQPSEGFGQWGDLIYMHALETVLEMGPRGLFTSLYSARDDVNLLSNEEVDRRCRNLDALIINQTDPHAPVLEQHCRQHGKPFVYLNPPASDSVSNFASLDHYTAFYNLARAFREAGRSRIVLLIYPRLERSVAVRQRLSGMINGIGEMIGNPVEFRVLLCPGVEPSHAVGEMEKLLASGFRPDAVLSAGDGLTLGALGVIEAAGLSVPEDVSFVAGAGFNSTVTERGLTTFVHPLPELGRSLVNMLLTMLEQQLVELPGRYLPIPLRIGESTRPGESALLKEMFGKLILPSS